MHCHPVAILFRLPVQVHCSFLRQCTCACASDGLPSSNLNILNSLICVLNIEEEYVFGQWHYMGVVSSSPLPHLDIDQWKHTMFTNSILLCRAPSCQNFTMTCIINADIYSIFIVMHICHSIRYSIIDKY